PCGRRWPREAGSDEGSHRLIDSEQCSTYPPSMDDDWLHERAREMRREPSLFERRLWKVLRDRRLAGLKFRRQFVFEQGPYIADFVCFRHRLIVEADGPRHDPAKDAIRDDWLRRQGFRILRFP